MSTNQLVWLITGTSSGVGRDLTLEALKRGDKVIATARNTSKIDPALRANGAELLQLDVTDSLDNLKIVAGRAIGIYGRVDVVVNNAGYVLVGAIEESTPEETFAQFNTNVFGALNVTRASLPHMRKRKSGTIFFVGSIGGWKAFDGVGIYCATKAALRGMTYTMHDEVKHLGIKIHCVEPGYFRTSLLNSNNRTAYEERIPDYAPVLKAANDMLLMANNKQPGDPAKLATALVDITKGEGLAKGRDVPAVFCLGSDAEQIIRKSSEDTIAVLEAWKDIMYSTDFPEGQ